MNILIIGCGQMGGSIALAAAANKSAGRIALYDADSSPPDTLLQRPEFHPLPKCLHKADRLAAAASAADIVVLSTPIDRFSAIVAEIAPFLKKGAIVTDVGSGKVKSIEAICAYLPKGVEYVPAHPTVGRDGHGPQTADPKMFSGQKIIIVPGCASKDAEEKIKQLWTEIGGIPVSMNAEAHDKVYGTISHLQHAIVFSVMAMGQQGSAVDRDYLSAGNFLRDLTRVGNSNPQMWIPIFQDNKEAILTSAGSYRKILINLAGLLDDPARLKAEIAAAHDYVRPMQTRESESIYADLYDVTHRHEEPGTLTGCFNRESLAAIAKVVSLPALLAVGMALNARRLEEENPGLTIADIVNPSFKDGTRALANRPEEIAALLLSNGQETKKNLQNFMSAFDRTIDAIRSNDTVAITGLIETSRQLRHQMPPVRKPQEEIRQGDTAEPLRPDFII